MGMCALSLLAIVSVVTSWHRAADKYGEALSDTKKNKLAEGVGVRKLSEWEGADFL